MQFRIINHGVYYILQRKGWIFWNTHGEYVSGMDGWYWEPIRFDTEAEALAYAKKLAEPRRYDQRPYVCKIFKL